MAFGLSGAPLAMLISSYVGAASAVGQTISGKQTADDQADDAMKTAKAGEVKQSSTERKNAERLAAAEGEDVAINPEDMEPEAMLNRTRASGRGGVSPELLRLGSSAIFGAGGGVA